MAREDNEDRYKEGVDFEWVKAKGSNYKTRRFFSKAEKRARAEKSKTAEAATDDKPTGSTKPKTRPERGSAPQLTADKKPKARPAAKPTAPKEGPNFERRGRQADRPMSTTGAEGNARRDSLRRGRFGNGSAEGMLLPPRADGIRRRGEDNKFKPDSIAFRLEEGLRNVFGGGGTDSGRAAAQRMTNRQEESAKAMGMRKGGLVDTTNKGKVGASMAPTQKKFRTQSRKGK